MKTPLLKAMLGLFLLAQPVLLLGQVTASFTVSDQVPCTGTVVYFTNTSINATQYYWDFGDAGSADVSTLANPSYSYTTTGNMVVRLIASDGTDKDTAYVALGVGGPLMFTFSQLNLGGTLCVGGELVLNGSVPVTGNYPRVNYVTWIWGDGDTSYTSGYKNFARHKYAAPGLYKVKTIAHGSCMNDYDSTFYNIVSGNNCSLRLQMGYSTLPLCLGTYYLHEFFEGYIGPLDSLRWTTSDGETSTSARFIHFYNQKGAIKITLKAWRNGKVDSVSATTIVTDSVEDISIRPVQLTPTTAKRRTNAPVDIGYGGLGVAYRYTFGDGTPDEYTYDRTIRHVFSAPGSYSVGVYSYSKCGGVPDSNFSTVTVADTFPWFKSFAAQTTYCPGEQAYLTLSGMDTMDIMWYINNDSIAGNRAPWVFDTAGNYYVRYRFSDYNGGYSMDSVLIVVGDRPVLAGTMTVAGGVPSSCPSTPVVFNYSGRDKVILVDFGDGSQVNNPTFPLFHQFTAEGNYPVLYTVQSPCGTKASGAYMVGVDHLVTDESFTNPNPYMINCAGGLSIVPGNPKDSVKIFFGNGKDTILPPVQRSPLIRVYDSAGTYSVKTVKLHGCAGEYNDTAYGQAYIYEPLRARMLFSEDTLLVGDTLSLIDISHAGFADTYWSINGAAPAYRWLNNPKWVFTEPGEYDITLLLQSGYDCTADTTLHITVLDNGGSLMNTSLSNSNFNYRLYPNPTQGAVTLEYPAGEGSISIMDFSGREIWQTRTDGSGKQLLPLEQLGLNAGIYLIRFEQGEEQVVIRLAFQR